MAAAAAFHLSMKFAREVNVSTRPMIAQPPMPKNMTIFCARAKILMPNTTNRKPTMLKIVAMMKRVPRGGLTSQFGRPVQPR